MIPAAFDYTRVGSLASAIALMQGHAGNAKLLAGGHSLLPLMKLRLASPALLIDIGDVPELQDVVIRDGEAIIGAGVRHATLEHDSALAVAVPLLPLVAKTIADPAVRNRGTLGGSLAHADPSADWPAAMLALNASLEIVGPAGTRNLSADKFFKGLFQTDLRPAEVIVSIHVPASQNARAAYKKFRHPASGYAVVGVAVVLEVTQGRFARASVGVTGYADHAFRATGAEACLVGLGTDEPLESVLDKAFEGIDALEDGFADSAYRRQIGRTMLRRALGEALSESV